MGLSSASLRKRPGICGDTICRIPSLWRWPGHFKAGNVSTRITETVDVAPTLCALAGLPPMPTADGEDITSLLRGEDREIHKIGVTKHPWSKAVLKGDWRLVYYPHGFFTKNEDVNGDFGELYHLSDDPWEMKNLYFDPQYRQKIVEMQRDLLDWFVTTTRSKTMLPEVPRGADGKFPWRGVKAMDVRNYK